jgi:hypothetical protein
MFDAIRDSGARGRRPGLPTGLANGLAAVMAAALLTPLLPASSAEAATAAGSIVFIKDYNVWIARGDGTGARAVTTDGREALPYRNPSQSDTGLIAAASFGKIVTLDQQGNQLAEIDPPPLPGSGGHALDGTPVAVSVSPDGRLIAYSFAEYCGSGCGYRTATGYTSSTGATDPSIHGTSFFDDPSWISNSRTVQSGGATYNAMVHDLGSPTQQHWFDHESQDYGNVEVSPDGRLIAGVGSENVIYTYNANGNVATDSPPRWPARGCTLKDDSPATYPLTDPTWGPDGRTLAFETPDGITTFDHPAAGGDCSRGAIALIIPGGSDPDWSTAPLSEPTMTAVAAPELSGRAAVGGTLEASTGTWSAPPTKLGYQWLRDGRPISGATGASYDVTRADAGQRLTVRVTADRPGWPSGSATSGAVSIPAASDPPGHGSTLHNTRRPSILGKPVVGHTVRAKPGAWKPAPTKVSYRWLRDGRAIKRATGPKYKLTRADLRHRIAVRVVASRNAARGTAVSKAVTVRR